MRLLLEIWKYFLELVCDALCNSGIHTMHLTMKTTDLLLNKTKSIQFNDRSKCKSTERHVMFFCLNHEICTQSHYAWDSFGYICRLQWIPMYWKSLCGQAPLKALSILHGQREGSGLFWQRTGGMQLRYNLTINRYTPWKALWIFFIFSIRRFSCALLSLSIYEYNYNSRYIIFTTEYVWK